MDGSPAGRRRSVTRRRIGAVLAAAAALLVALLAVPAARADAATGPALVVHPAGLVDPFIGGSPSAGGQPADGETSPGAAWPHGDVTLVAASATSRQDGSGYDGPATSTLGVTSTDVDGAGCRSGSDLPVLPLASDVTDPSSPSSASAPVSAQRADPGFYSARIGSVPVATAASGLHSGIETYTFPGSGVGELLVKLAGSEAADSAETATMPSPTTLDVAVTTGQFCSTAGGTRTLHEVLELSRRASPAWWQGTAVRAGPLPAAGTPLAGVILRFGAGAPVSVKVALSYVSAAGATRDLSSAAGGWSLRAASVAATTAWNVALTPVQVSASAPHAELVSFYSALYRIALDPVVVSDTDGRYVGFDGAVHDAPSGAAIVGDVSGWDIEKGDVQLLTILSPEIATDLADTCLAELAQVGKLCTWVLGSGNETGVMVGQPFDQIVAGVSAFGAGGFDTTTALTAMVDAATTAGLRSSRVDVTQTDSLGYLPSEASPQSLGLAVEYQADDLAAANLATRLGETSVASRMNALAGQAEKLIDPASDLLTPRDDKGAFRSGVGASSEAGTTEASNAQETASISPAESAALVQAVGGPAKLAAWLAAFLNTGNRDGGPQADLAAACESEFSFGNGRCSAGYWVGNEDDFEAPWLYALIGDRAAADRDIRETEIDWFPDTPGGIPGNDDLGAEAAWLVWADLGVYPTTPGSAALTADSPLFTDAVLHLPSGRTLTITGRGAAADAPFVTALDVDGAPADGVTLPASLVAAGGTIDFTVSATAP